MRFELRRGEIADLGALLRLEQLFPGDHISARAWRHLLAAPSSEVWVAVEGEGGRVVGDAVLALRRGSQRARVSTLVVDPEARRSGVASALLQRLEERALARGAQVMRLEVRFDNREACAFYQRTGYAKIGVRTGYYEDGAEALLMEKRLEAG